MEMHKVLLDNISDYVENMPKKNQVLGIN